MRVVVAGVDVVVVEVGERGKAPWDVEDRNRLDGVAALLDSAAAASDAAMASEDDREGSVRASAGARGRAACGSAPRSGRLVPVRRDWGIPVPAPISFAPTEVDPPAPTLGPACLLKLLPGRLLLPLLVEGAQKPFVATSKAARAPGLGRPAVMEDDGFPEEPLVREAEAEAGPVSLKS